MRILVLGGTGMLGHLLIKALKDKEHEVLATNEDLGILFDSKPQAVVNCIGIVKNRPEADDMVKMIAVNGLFPHELDRSCKHVGARLVHISTDCVFSGINGAYSESDTADPVDPYGKSKLIGEVWYSENCLTIRTSFIGREVPPRKRGLLEWFLSQTENVNGRTNAIFSGLTTIEFSRVIEKIITQHPEKHGIYHISGPAISKYDLLCLIKKHFNAKIEIVPVDEPCIDRSLDSTKFRTGCNYSPPSWEEMIKELAENA